MREILFRGKRVEDDRWIEGNLVKTKTGASYILVPSEDLGVNQTSQTISFLVCYSSVGQYTGLKDKSSVKIFEGDVVETPYLDPIFGDMINGVKTVGAIVFESGCYCVYYKDNDRIVSMHSLDHKLKVIGNIYDNPNLLESEEY